MDTMDEKRIAAALEAVEQFQKERGISQTQAGKMVGVSGSILSSIRSGTYSGDTMKQIKILENYFSIKGESKGLYKEVEYAETSISSKVYGIIKLCRVKGGLASFSGDAGIGKTKAIEKYVSDNPSGTVFISVNPCFRSVKSILKLLASQMGVRKAGGIDDMWLAIRERISDGMVWIFDESQLLTYNSIEVIRSFSDDCAARGQTLGVCFVGNIDTNRKLSMFAQLDSRTRLKPVYTRSKIKRDDVKMLFPLLDEKGMEAEIDFLWGIAQKTPEGLRGAVSLFGQAYDNNENYTLAGLAKIAKGMGLDLSGTNAKRAGRGKGAA